MFNASSYYHTKTLVGKPAVNNTSELRNDVVYFLPYFGRQSEAIAIDDRSGYRVHLKQVASKITSAHLPTTWLCLAG